MSYVVVCQSCSKKNAIADDVFERRIIGRKVSLRCKGCQQAIHIDGTDPVQRAKLSVPNVSGATQRPPVAPAAPIPAIPPLLLPAARPPRPNVTTKTLLGLAAPPLVVQPPRLPDEEPAVAPPAEPLEVAPPIPVGSSTVTTTLSKQKVDVTPSAVVMAPMDELAGRTSTSAVGRDQRSRAASGSRWIAFSAVFALVVVAAVTLAVTRDLVTSAASERVLEGPDAPAAASEPARAPRTVEHTTPGPAESQPPAPAAPAPPAPATSEEPAAPAVTAADESGIPSTVDAQTVLDRTAVALRRAERCHSSGRAAGSADIFITFAPRGRVAAVRLEGEQLARAPVARCILEHARSIKIPAYKGEPFTLRQKITLR